jgi:hypothetical protein
MKMFGDLTMIGGRMRGLPTAIYPDEAVAKADLSNLVAKRVLSVLGASGDITCNWSLYDEIRITSVAEINLTFTGGFDGQGCILTLIGGNPVNLPANVRYNSIVNVYVPTLGAGVRDKVGFMYDNTDSKYDIVSVVKDIS